MSGHGSDTDVDMPVRRSSRLTIGTSPSVKQKQKKRKNEKEESDGGENAMLYELRMMRKEMKNLVTEDSMQTYNARVVGQCEEYVQRTVMPIQESVSVVSNQIKCIQSEIKKMQDEFGADYARQIRSRQVQSGFQRI